MRLNLVREDFVRKIAYARYQYRTSNGIAGDAKDDWKKAEEFVNRLAELWM